MPKPKSMSKPKANSQKKLHTEQKKILLLHFQSKNIQLWDLSKNLRNLR